MSQDELSPALMRLQSRMRASLRTLLRRHNGIVKLHQLEVAFGALPPALIQKKIQRLTTQLNPVHYEWKAELQTWDAVVKKLGPDAKGVNYDLLRNLFHNTRAAEERSQYSYLATSNSNKLVSVYDFNRPPVFGFDVLVRPPNEFTDTSSNHAPTHNLKVSDEGVVFVIHGDFIGDRLDPVGEYMTRIVYGGYFAAEPWCEMLATAAFMVETNAKKYLLDGDAQGVCTVAVTSFNQAVGEIFNKKLARA